MKKIKLTQNKYALVDNEDYGFLNKFSWRYNSSEGYARTNFAVNIGKRKDVGMHRLVINPFTEYQIDHINGNKLDNRKQNLRVCTQKENIFNRKPLHNKSSKYKGVGFYKRTKQWQARITINGKLIHLGMFSTEKEAALVYNKAAKKFFGKHAWLNFRNIL